MKIVYCIYTDNHRVVDYYINTIKESLIEEGFEVLDKTLSEARKSKKADAYIVAEEIHMLILYMCGCRNFIYWSQGVSPEESYMRNHSKMRLYVRSRIEAFALRKAKICLFVSKTQKDYYEKKYGVLLDNKSYIMPCYNCEINREAFYTNGKYDNNVFCYAGGLAIWQCFRETAALYKRIEEKVPNSFFKILAPDKEKVIEVVNELGIRNYSVNFVKQQYLEAELADCKYGFIIREDSIVNNVATPTKLSTYLSNGLIPIITDALYDFSIILKPVKHAIVLHTFNDVDLIVKMARENLTADRVYEEFKFIFDDYYNTEKHKVNIKELIRKTFKRWYL